LQRHSTLPGEYAVILDEGTAWTIVALFESKQKGAVRSEYCEELSIEELSYLFKHRQDLISEAADYLSTIQSELK